jgi:hypothetical protein
MSEQNYDKLVEALRKGMKVTIMSGSPDAPMGPHYLSDIPNVVVIERVQEWPEEIPMSKRLFTMSLDDSGVSLRVSLRVAYSNKTNTVYVLARK